METLEEGGWLDNAIIVVASDNGGCPGSGGINYPYRGEKKSMFEGGSKVRKDTTKRPNQIAVVASKEPYIRELERGVQLLDSRKQDSTMSLLPPPPK